MIRLPSCSLLSFSGESSTDFPISVSQLPWETPGKLMHLLKSGPKGLERMPSWESLQGLSWPGVSAENEWAEGAAGLHTGAGYPGLL